MKLFLQLTFKELYYFLKTPRRRIFMWLVLKYSSIKRYKTSKICFLGNKFIVPDVLSFLWQFHDIFAEEIYKFESPKTSPVIYDCGANVGTSCLYFKKLYPNSRIRAFEADPEISNILKQNMKANRLDIEIISKAVWCHNRGIEISIEGADGASIFGDSNKQQIPSVRLKDELRKEQQIDFLKIDVEGAEIELFKDCADELFRVENIFVEFHSFVGKPQNLDVLFAILQNSGFRFYVHHIELKKFPYINKTPKNNKTIDLQLNIFAWKAH